MTYAGNPNLPPEVQKRILDTFRHTLDVAARGGLEEARLGCDFVLQLDSQFTLARTLSERLRGASGPVAVDDLRAKADGLGAPAAAAPRPAAPAPAAAAPAVKPDELRRELGRLFLARDFPSLMGRAKQEQAAIAADPKLQALLAQAQELMEAAPYVDRFLQKARGARAAGQQDEVRALVEKARALDPEHPALSEFAAATAAAPAPPPRMAPPSPPPMEERFPPAAPPVFAATPPGADEMSFGDLDTHALPASPPADDLSMSLPSDDELPMDLPPFDMSSLESLDDEPLAAPAMAEELSLEGLSLEPATASAPAAGGPSDPDPRIAELLDDGQAQYERGELQSAIDAWSRIFLIDIDHHEAARRIDQARNAKAEQERQIEEAFHDALGQIQAKDFDGAKAALERVLSMSPNHVAARDTLAKLERGEVASLPSAPAAAAAGGGLLDELSAAGEEDLKEEILVPPDPGERKAPVVSEKPAPPKSKRPLALAAAAAVVVLAAGGWFVMTRWSSLFPNTEAQPVKQAVEQTPITRAKDLYKQGKRTVAISQLKRVPPASPYFDEAQALIAQWQAEESATTATTGPSVDQLAQREALMAQARQAESERHFMAVGPLLTQAAAIAPLSEEETAMLGRAKAAVAPLEATLTLLRAEEYDRSLRDLWVILDKDQGNADARTMLTTAYYNKGVLSLQQGNAKEAEDNLKEAVALTPADADVQRLLRFAQTYESRDQDLLYRIYTKYLTARPL
jgi:tetratricopeptide (TPR) repeat protein